MIVSGLQQSDSVLHIHVSLLFQILFPFGLLHTIEQSSLCYTVGPCWGNTILCSVPQLENQTFWRWKLLPNSTGCTSWRLVLLICFFVHQLFPSIRCLFTGRKLFLSLWLVEASISLSRWIIWTNPTFLCSLGNWFKVIVYRYFHFDFLILLNFSGAHQVLGRGLSL